LIVNETSALRASEIKVNIKWELFETNFGIVLEVYFQIDLERP